jgi:hypothetical protein
MRPTARRILASVGDHRDNSTNCRNTHRTSSPLRALPSHIAPADRTSTAVVQSHRHTKWLTHLLPLAADSDLVETVVVTVAVAAAVDVVAVAASPRYAQAVPEGLECDI